MIEGGELGPVLQQNLTALKGRYELGPTDQAKRFENPGHSE